MPLIEIKNNKIVVVPLEAINNFITKETLLLVPFILGFIVFFTVISSVFIVEQHNVYLADAFIKGKLYLLSSVSGGEWYDTSLFNGNRYWPLGIFPTIALIPLVLIFGTTFLQGYVSFPLVVATFVLLYKLALKITENMRTSFFLASTYVFGSAFIMVAFSSISWYFAHVVATFCLVLAIYYILVLEKPLLAGVFFSFAFLSRISISLGVGFFILQYALSNKRNIKTTLTKFFIPVLFGVLVFTSYNYVRFGAIFETGYSMQELPAYLERNREYGMWSPHHFATNIYIFTLKGPIAEFSENSLVLKNLYPSVLGMSIIYTSPIFLYILAVNLRKKENLIALLGAIPIAIFVFGSFGIGIQQYGYRFALDFQPFLFLILCDVFKNIKITTRKLLLFHVSYTFNFYMIFKFYMR